jgi:hypothetical protein
MYSGANTLSSILFVFLMPNIDFVAANGWLGMLSGQTVVLLWALAGQMETSLEGEENTTG